MQAFLIYFILGLSSGAIYAISATGLVLTYTTSRIFNFAQGAIGMLLAFVYYQFRVTWHVPEVISLIITLVVIGPAFGIVLDRLLMRRLARASVVLRLMGTLALFVFLEGVALLIWGTSLRYMPAVISLNTVDIGGVGITYDEIAAVVAAAVVGLGLWIFLRRTRLGTAMRAVIDDTNLAELTGVSPNRVQAISWSIGTSLAGLAAILIAPQISLDIPDLSLLVISAIAAAIIGRLANIGWTFVGGIGLGVLTTLVIGYLPAGNQIVEGLSPSMPFIVLFLALMVLRQERQAQHQTLSTAVDVTVSARRTVTWALAGLVVAVAVTPHLSDFLALVAASGLIYGAVLLSLVLLTGMGGQISLCQFSFVGLGAVLLAHLADHMAYIFAAGLATIITAAVGVLISLPALRLRGLYLALATLAFAIMCDDLVFPNSHVMGPFGQAILVPSPELFGHSLASRHAYVIAGTILVVVFALFVQSLRRGRFGRGLNAMKDAPDAAEALGLNLVMTKMLVFGIAAGMCGLAGCLYGGLLGEAGGTEFTYFVSLTAVLILAVQGMTAVPGAILGGLFYAFTFLLLPQWISSTFIVNAIQPLAIGGAVFVIVNHPEGAWLQQVNGLKKLRRKISPPKAKPPRHLDPSEPVKPLAESGAEPAL